jgi:hypothetical protein
MGARSTRALYVASALKISSGKFQRLQPPAKPAKLFNFAQSIETGAVNIFESDWWGQTRRSQPNTARSSWGRRFFC